MTPACRCGDCHAAQSHARSAATTYQANLHLASQSQLSQVDSSLGSLGTHCSSRRKFHRIGERRVGGEPRPHGNRPATLVQNRSTARQSRSAIRSLKGNTCSAATSRINPPFVTAQRRGAICWFKHGSERLGGCEHAAAVSSNGIKRLRRAVEPRERIGRSDAESDAGYAHHRSARARLRSRVCTLGTIQISNVEQRPAPAG